MKRTLIVIFLLFSGTLAEAQSADHNYIRYRTYTDSSYIDNIKYFDELGYLSQDIQCKNSPSGKDIVTIHKYDFANRENSQILPGNSIGGGGYADVSLVTSSAIKMHANDQYPFITYTYESSSLNRVNNVEKAGIQWKLHNKSIKNIYLSNNLSGITACAQYIISGTGMSTSSIKKIGTYEAGQLSVTQTEDEDGDTVLIFKDLLNHTILNRHIISGNNYADTYYIYDPLGNLCIVLPPMASSNLTQNNVVWNDTNEAMNFYAYLYEYDEYNNCIKQKLPGTEWIYYRYDKAGHRLFTQDGELRKDNKWKFALYDLCDRKTITGICSNNDVDNYKDTLVYTTLSANGGYLNTGYTLNGGLLLSSPVILSISYYDTYSFLSLPCMSSFAKRLTYAQKSGYENRIERLSNGIDVSAFGLQTGQRTYILNDPTKEIVSATYYNYKNNPIQILSTNQFENGYEKEYINYTLTGKRLKRFHEHNDGRGHDYSEEYVYTYDNGERLKNVYHTLNNNSKVLLTSYTYDDLGRLIGKSFNNNVYTIYYAYNVQDWMSSITGTKFNEAIYYNTGNGIPRYNGDISSMTWQAGNESITRGYKFTYDKLNRMIEAIYGEGTNISNNMNNYSECITGYTANGAITGLQRYGKTTTGNYALIDDLTYTLDGNRLKNVTDAATTVPNNNGMHFVDGANQTTEYIYDSNGNLTEDMNKGINNITYNVLNLPNVITMKNGTTSYEYSAEGTKLEEMHGNNITDYCGNIIYENNALDEILTDEGYITINGAIPTYHYYIKDHEGNNRVVINQNGTVEQVNHYYPFGSLFTESSNGTIQKYKYNGKELDTDKGLNLYDYGARFYDPELCLWHGVDPSCEKYCDISPYVYCGNNPIKLIDPTGMIWSEVVEASRFITDATRKIFYLLNAITNTQYELNDNRLNKSTIALDKRMINGFKDRISFLIHSIYEIDQLGKDKSHVYVINNIKGNEGDVTLGKDNKIYINIPTKGLFYHEADHISQSLNKGNLYFINNNLQNSGENINERIENEIDAYKSQAAFNGYINGISIYSPNDITPEMIKTEKNANGSFLYPYMNP